MTEHAQVQQIDVKHLGIAAEVAYEINNLSAVPYEGWCDKAAEMIATKAPEAVVCVTIGQFAESGAMRTVYCEGTHYPDTMRSREKGASGISKSALSSLNWWIKSDEPAVALLRNLSKNVEWTTSASGGQWTGFGIEHMIVGLGRLPGENERKHIAIEIGYPKDAETEPGEACVSVVRSLMPLLCGRAGLAFNAHFNGLMVTNREVEVLESLIMGKSVKEIAEDMDRSEHTIHDHVKSLHKKLGATSRGQLIARALGHLSLRNDVRVKPGLRPSVAENRAKPVDQASVAMNG